MTREELGLARERFVHPLKAALVMMGAETIGGLVPLTPYLITPNVQTGFTGGIIVTFASLFAIGVWKTTFTKKNKLRSGLEMVVAGTLATVIPYFIGNVLSSLALPI